MLALNNQPVFINKDQTNGADIHGRMRTSPKWLGYIVTHGRHLETKILRCCLSIDLAKDGGKLRYVSKRLTNDMPPNMSNADYIDVYIDHE